MHGPLNVLDLAWKKQARVDLLNIVTYIARDNPDAAEKLANEIEDKAAQLRIYPKSFRLGRKRGTRELVAHSNYLVIYRIQNETIEILRVKHVAQQMP